MLLPRRLVIEHPLPSGGRTPRACSGWRFVPLGPGRPCVERTTHPLAIPADLLHVTGVGIWLGGLVVLFAAFMRAPTSRPS
jgi:hypothetical protein